MDMMEHGKRYEGEDLGEPVNCYHCGAPILDPQLGAEAALCEACDNRD